MKNSGDLEVLAKTRALTARLYRATARLSAADRFGIGQQMQRAAVSIGSNIAEGCGRSGDREFARYLHIAMGSAAELEYQLQVTCDLDLLRAADSSALLADTREIRRMLLALIRYYRKQLRR